MLLKTVASTLEAQTYIDTRGQGGFEDHLVMQATELPS